MRRPRYGKLQQSPAARMAGSERAAELVDGDAVVDGQAGLLGQFHVGLHADAHQHHVGVDASGRPAARRRRRGRPRPAAGAAPRLRAGRHRARGAARGSSPRWPVRPRAAGCAARLRAASPAGPCLRPPPPPPARCSRRRRPAAAGRPPGAAPSRRHRPGCASAARPAARRRYRPAGGAAARRSAAPAGCSRAARHPPARRGCAARSMASTRVPRRSVTFCSSYQAAARIRICATGRPSARYFFDSGGRWYGGTGSSLTSSTRPSIAGAAHAVRERGGRMAAAHQHHRGRSFH